MKYILITKEFEIEITVVEPLPEIALEPNVLELIIPLDPNSTIH